MKELLELEDEFNKLGDHHWHLQFDLSIDDCEAWVRREVANAYYRAAKRIYMLRIRENA